MSKPSKQLGQLLGGTPRTTASSPASVREPVAYATKPVATPMVIERTAAARSEDEGDTLLQVMVPMRVRRQLERRHVEERKPLRTLVLEALRKAGVEVSEEEMGDRRKKRRKL